MGLNQIFATSKEIQDSTGFWIPHRGFRILGTGFQSLSVELGFWIPIVSGIPDSLSRIPDSKAQDSGFHEQKFPGFRNPKAKNSRISEFGFPYMTRKQLVGREKFETVANSASFRWCYMYFFLLNSSNLPWLERPVLKIPMMK